MLSDVPYLENLTDQVYCRKFEGPKGVPVDSAEERNEFYTLYESFTYRLPGNTRFRPIGVLAWGIAIEAGLLNRQLHEDMKQTKGADDYVCPADVDTLMFYPPAPSPEAELVFQEYVKARWPMITFALEPVIDQQNIDDSFTRRRDLQLASLSPSRPARSASVRPSTYTRQLQYEAQTIALNQTVAAFAHGNDTFGWKFSPRYQTPPEESNIRAVTNLLIRGGPGPNYQIDNSKIEPGMRELTAVVVMPSFVRGMRIDVSGNWFRLHDPDERKIHTARTIEQGRQINEARQALDVACKCGLYRPEDVERLRVRLHQLESDAADADPVRQGPLREHPGRLRPVHPGGDGAGPRVVGLRRHGLHRPDQAERPHGLWQAFQPLRDRRRGRGRCPAPRRDGDGRRARTPPGGKSLVVGTTLSPLRTTDGNLVAPDSTGKPLSGVTIKDQGSYDILSREVMRVRIPAGVAVSTREDLSQYVELRVSTPNGISNRIEIPLNPGQAATAVAGGPGYVFLDTGVKVNVAAHVDSGNATPDQAIGVAPDAAVRIQPIDRSHPLPSAIKLTATFPLKGTNVVSSEISIDNIKLVGGSYVISADQLTAFSKQLVSVLLASGTTPLADISPSTLVLQPSVIQGADAAPASSATNAPKFSFTLVLSQPQAAAGAAGGPSTALEPPAENDAVEKAEKKDDPVTRRTSFEPPTTKKTSLRQLPTGAAGTPAPATPAVPTIPAVPAIPVVPGHRRPGGRLPSRSGFLPCRVRPRRHFS